MSPSPLRLITAALLWLAPSLAIAQTITTPLPAKIGIPWTPTFTFGTPGDLSVAYTTQTATYSCVSGVITAAWKLTFVPTYTTSSGVLEVDGLPYAPLNDATNAAPLRQVDGLSWTGDQIAGQILASGNAGAIRIIQWNKTGTASAGLTTSSVASGTTMSWSGTVTYTSATRAC